MKWAGVAAAAVVSLWAMNASAATIIATYTGTVNNINDGANLFAPGDLTNDPFSIVFTFASSNYVVGSGDLKGGDDESIPTPLQSVVLNINGATYDIPVFAELGQLASRYATYKPVVESESDDNSGYSGDGDFIDIDAQANIANTSISPIFSGTGSGYGTFILGNGQTSGGLNVDTFSVDVPISPVPEPAMWSTLICGFGFIGARLRRSMRLRSSATSVA